MDWKYLFLSANGRIGQKDFWIGFAILFGIMLVFSAIPGLNLLSPIVGLALIYPWVCVYAKRLHDFGKTGWLILAPMGINLVLCVVAVMVSGGAAMATGGSAGGGVAAVFATMGIFVLLMMLVGLGFLLWVGLSKGDPETNKYGPPPTAVMGAAGSTV